MCSRNSTQLNVVVATLWAAPPLSNVPLGPQRRVDISTISLKPTNALSPRPLARAEACARASASTGNNNC